ncbi:MAG: flagellar motor protein MotD [Nitrosomonas sp.]|nr:MAG: flagellar motor protein MotD [Nitrosomonas sp.]
MRKRRNYDLQEYRENHDRWLVSYADFITLLFAFFVVMYAISSVNENKYRVLSGSLVNAFQRNVSEVKQPAATIPSPVETDLELDPEPEEATDPARERADETPDLDEQEEKERFIRQKKMRVMANDIMHVLAPLVQDGRVSVTQSVQGIAIEINASVLFSPGHAQLAENSIQTLRAVAAVVQGHEHEIQVEGHTDNIPIHTLHFPSNWELSTARASSVVRLFIGNGVNPQRLTAMGYGENRQVASNETPEGRARNRRVTIMIMSKEQGQVTEIPVDFVHERNETR